MPLIRRRSNHEKPQLSDALLSTRSIVIDTTQGKRHVGITLCDHSLGVKIMHCVCADLAAHAGLSPGDVICSINGVDLLNHQTATQLINEATEAEEELEIEYYPAKTVSHSNSSDTTAYPSLSLAHGLKAIVPAFS